MDQERLEYLITRYKSGSATAEEITELEQYWQEASLDRSFTADHTAAEFADIEKEMFGNIKSAIGKSDRTVSMRPSYGRLYYKLAATLLILLSVSIWWYAQSKDLIEIHTDFGERLTVTLPDESCVVLNGNSVLRYNRNWDDKAGREVWIEGEGFFSVIHEKDNQKFIVHAADYLDVEVLGTKFNVKARHSASEVLLAEGKVKLETRDAQQVFLKPGELATLYNKRLSTRSVERRRYTSWVESKLLLERTTLKEVATLLKETYGLEVKFSDPGLELKELSGEISSATEDDILSAIAETLDLKVDKSGRSVNISSEPDVTK